MKTPRPRNESLLDCTVTELGQADGALAVSPNYAGSIRIIGGVPGDRGLARVVHAGQHGVWAQWSTLSEAGPDRRPAPCPVVLRCGGCPWQMVEPSAQRAERLRRVRAALAPYLDKNAVQWGGPEGPDAGYRTRAQVVLGQRRGRIEWGFWQPSSQIWVAAEHCPAQTRDVDRVLHAACDVLGRHGVAVSHAPGSHGASGLVWRADPRTGLGLLTVLAPDPAAVAHTGEALLQIPGVQGVFSAIPSHQGGPANPATLQHLAGEARSPQTWQAAELPDLTLDLGPISFVQTRHDAAEALIAQVAAWLPARGEGLLDVFAGAGVFALAVRHRFTHVTLIERHGAASDDAHCNIAKLGAGHADVRHGDAAAIVAELLEGEQTYQAAVVDPPRAGCGPALVHALTQLPQLQTIVYVSCGLPGLQRDLAAFGERGWQASEVRVLDMFPHTPHAEVVVHIARAGATE
ncbi:MAG: class I SAM-dependent RNA methyltransferase [Deltaproteobacteria bacterium]|nr:class I SAM-dependent RNA methyltransferase [Deltaproteobacteria bacterium]